MLKSDHFGIEIMIALARSIGIKCRLKSDHFGIEMYLCTFRPNLQPVLKSDHFGIEIIVKDY